MDLCLNTVNMCPNLLAAGFSWFDPASLWAVAQVILGLGFVIFVHELGHFLVAKACGVKCEKFYVGFDMFDIKIGDRVIVPRSLIKYQWGETVYGIGIVPLGGYVKMLGQDDNPAKAAEELERSIKDASEGKEIVTSGPVDRTQLDPRSYQAKSVWQRMAIISAGVIMNLIFAVIFATIAFRLGVPYDPAIISTVLPGTPAYVQDLSNSEVISINGQQYSQVKDGRVEKDRYFRFLDLIESSAFEGETEMTLEVFRPGDSKASEVKITPKVGAHPGIDLPQLGIQPGAQSNQLIASDAISENSAASKASVPLADGDKFVSVNGKVADNAGKIKLEFTRNFDKPVEVVIERGGKTEQITSTIPANPWMESGLVFEISPILAIQVNSPAEEAGLEVGDKIISINDGPAGDPFDLGQRMTIAARENQQVKIVVQRESESGEQEILVTPRLPRSTSQWTFRNKMAIDPLGFCVAIENTISSVVANSPAEKAGFQPGDEVSQVQFQLTDELSKDSKYAGLKKPIDLTKEDDGGYIGNALMTMQQIRPAIPIDFTVNRDSESVDMTLTPIESDNRYSDIRGVVFGNYERVYVSGDLWESFLLGGRQTWEDMGRVFKFLKKLVRGDIAVTNLGGPGTIAQVATMEATNGTTRLLLFLTLLSANLAIVNFLPIPVLDGGHMVFLAYEAIFRRPVNIHMQEYLTYAGLFLILMLMVFVIGMDITRIIGW